MPAHLLSIPHDPFRIATRSTRPFAAPKQFLRDLSATASGISRDAAALLEHYPWPGNVVKKGEQIGYFQFGGSTHCLVFGPAADIDFASRAITQGANGTGSSIVRVNSYLATAR